MTPRIIVDSNIRRRFTDQLRRAGAREVGGILLGEQVSTGLFRLVDFSTDNVTGSAAHFHRSADQHSEKLEKFFAKTGYDFVRYNYLGEWHSHPRFSVLPSTQDCISMLELVRGEANIPFAALLIVRLDWFLFLKARATMFSQHRDPEPIAIERGKN